MSRNIITTRTDLINYLNDVRADVTDQPRGEEYIAAIADQIQHSDHPAWGQDWSEWLDENLDALAEETISGLVALEGTDAAETKETDETPLARAWRDGARAYMTGNVSTLIGPLVSGARSPVGPVEVGWLEGYQAARVAFGGAACSTSKDDDGVRFVWAGYLAERTPGDGTRECELLVEAGILEPDEDDDHEYHVYRVVD